MKKKKRQWVNAFLLSGKNLRKLYNLCIAIFYKRERFLWMLLKGFALEVKFIVCYVCFMVHQHNLGHMPPKTVNIILANLRVL
jgi:hypothetical protein